MTGPNYERHRGCNAPLRQDLLNPAVLVLGLVMELARRAVGVNPIDPCGNQDVDLLGQGAEVDLVVRLDRQEERCPIAAQTHARTPSHWMQTTCSRTGPVLGAGSAGSRPGI